MTPPRTPRLLEQDREAALEKALWTLYWNVTDHDLRRYLPDENVLREVREVLGRGRWPTPVEPEQQR